MKTTKRIALMSLFALLAASWAFAQTEGPVKPIQVRHGHRFVDQNGDGYNDNAPDADGDGIPNGLDPDYKPPGLGLGRGARGFIDADGDGINDRFQDFDGDGIPNGQDPDYERPLDGTGRRLSNRWNRGGGMGRWGGQGRCGMSGASGRRGGLGARGGRK